MHGPVWVAHQGLLTVQSHLACSVLPRYRRPDHFLFDGRQLRYARRPYNHAWRNERSAELAIAFDFLDRRPPGPTLELGNVLSHYGRTGHVVVDKYEEAPGVVNEDITTWPVAERFTTVVSISTLEHIGWDETPRTPGKVDVAIDRLVSLLDDGGALLVTTPLGHNRHLDERLRDDALPFITRRWLVRGPGNRWTETTKDVALSTPYDTRAACAGAVFVGGASA